MGMLDLRSMKKAVEALKIAFEIYDHNTLSEDRPEKVVLRDGVIQRFEFTFELSWKMLKRYLEEFGLEKVDGLNNRDLFRVGFEQGLLEDPEVWFHYLKMRNQSSHIYDVEKAAMVFSAARNFQQDAQSLLERLEAKSH
jgi:nucleotidyltransferase substrate binding protein (TIGR01987 family)